MESLHYLEIGLSNLVAISKLTLEIFSVICVITGFLKTLQLAIKLRRNRDRFCIYNKVRLKLGMWLALALEFQLAADILATTIAPTFESLGRLGFIALIRTFLNYFLSKEIDAELKVDKNLDNITQENTI